MPGQTSRWLVKNLGNGRFFKRDSSKKGGLTKKGRSYPSVHCGFIFKFHCRRCQETFMKIECGIKELCEKSFENILNQIILHASRKDHLSFTFISTKVVYFKKHLWISSHGTLRKRSFHCDYMFKLLCGCIWKDS